MKLLNGALQVAGLALLILVIVVVTEEIYSNSLPVNVYIDHPNYLLPVGVGENPTIKRLI